MDKQIKFGELREYISRIDRISIYILQTQNESHYKFIEQVPDSYDEYYLYNIGMVKMKPVQDERYFYEHCIIITLSEKGRLD